MASNPISTPLRKSKTSTNHSSPQDSSPKHHQHVQVKSAVSSSRGTHTVRFQDDEKKQDDPHLHGRNHSNVSSSSYVETADEALAMAAEAANSALKMTAGK
jgi:hypothetical protein